MPTAVKTRRLSDLYRIGKEITLSDPEGDITVYIEKLNPVEGDRAIRAANAVRAAYLTDCNNHESDSYLDSLNEILDFSDQELTTYIVTDELARRTPALEAEWADENGWTKDDLLQGLYDRWNEPGVQEAFHAAPEDRDANDPEVKEAKKIHAELGRYSEGLDKYLAGHQEHIEAEYAKYTREKMVEKVVDRIIRMQSDLAWMIEYRKMEVFLGVKNSKKDRTRYFEYRRDVDDLQSEILSKLIEEMTNLSVEVDQGKGSEETATSSN